ncbi:TAXI family TRAP transporter solute-binding subunit [Leucobacter sp. HY1908]
MRRAGRALAAALGVLVGLAGLAVGLTGCSAGSAGSAGADGSAGSSKPTGAGDSSYVIAGGGRAGVYYNYGDELAGAARESLGLDIQVAQTQGSVDNLLLVNSGQALIGFAQGDTAADAVAGVGAFTEPLPITALARVYDEHVQVVVPEDSDVRELADLRGHTVSLGAENSGVHVIATRLLEAAGVDPSEVAGPALGLDASLTALEAGDIDGFFWVGGLPTPGIVQLANDLPIRLLEVPPDIVDRVNEGHAGVYRSADFAAGTYGIEHETATMSVPNYLIAQEAAPKELIRNLLGVLFEERGAIATRVRAAAFLDRRQAIFTEPVPLHSGATEYYRAARR